MLKALGEQLKLLSRDPKNNYTAIIRRLTGPREAVRYGQPLRQMILALPAMVAQLRNWSEQSGAPSRDLKIQKFALAYLYNPTDYLCVKGAGLFHYLDDAYLMARVYELTLENKDRFGLKNKSFDKALAKNIPQWIALAREILPRETGEIDRMVNAVARGRKNKTAGILLNNYQREKNKKGKKVFKAKRKRN